MNHLFLHKDHEVLNSVDSHLLNKDTEKDHHKVADQMADKVGHLMVDKATHHQLEFVLHLEMDNIEEVLQASLSNLIENTKLVRFLKLVMKTLLDSMFLMKK